MWKFHAQWFVALAFSLAVAVSAFSQGRERSTVQIMEIHGQVRYADGSAPAQFVLVQLEQFSGGFVGEIRTDRTGNFRFPGLRPTRYRITVTAPGFQKEEQEVDLETFSSNYIQFRLRKAFVDIPVAPAKGSDMIIDIHVPVEARDEFEKGRRALLDEKNFETGIEHLEKAVKIYPNFLDAHLLLGTACMDSHQLDKAEHALQEVLKINPKTPTALVALGEVYRERGRYDAAEKNLQEGLKLDDHSWQGHLALARLYWETKKVEKAGPEVGRTIQLKPDCAEAHLLGGNILLRARQAENALLMFEEYLRLEPNGAYAQQTRELVGKIKQALAAKQDK